MSCILKSVLLILRIASAIVEGVLSTLQNISGIIESTFKADGVSTALTINEGSKQYDYQVKQCSDSSETKPYITSNLGPRRKITITDGNIDNFLAAPLSVETEKSKIQITGNKRERNNVVFKLSLEVVSPDSDSFATTVDGNVLQNEIPKIDISGQQTEAFRKSMSKEFPRNICMNTIDQMGLRRKTKERSRSFSFGSEKNLEASGFGENIRTSSCNRFDKDEALRLKLLPAQATNESKRDCIGKSLQQSRGRTAGIKRRHLKDDLDNSTTCPTSEEIKTLIPHVPLKKKSSNLEETILHEPNWDLKDLGRRCLVQLKELREIPLPYPIDSGNNCESKFVCINCLCSADIYQKVTSKNEFKLHSSPELDDHYISAMSNYIKINQNNIVQCLSTVNRQLGGISKNPISLTLASNQNKSSDCVSIHSQTKHVTHKTGTDNEYVQINEELGNAIQEHSKEKHGNSQEKTEASISHENNDAETQCEMARIRCKEQNKEMEKITKNDENPGLEMSNRVGIEQELEVLPKVSTASEQEFNSSRNKTDETEIFSGDDLPTDQKEGDECKEN